MARWSLSASDRGLAYGDGVFETIAVIDHQPVLLEPHLLRLFRGLVQLRFEVVPERNRLQQDIEALAQTVTRGVIKVIVTRGEGGRGYTPPAHGEPTVVLSQHDWPVYPSDYWQQGIDVLVCGTRLAQQPTLAGSKHLNRLEQVLASQEYAQAQCPEGLMLDTKDQLVCATKSNVFLVKGKSLLTPKLDQCGIQGVMRNTVMDLAKKFGFAVSEQRLTMAQLQQADEVFLTSSIMGIWPVANVRMGSDDSLIIPVGAHTRALQYALQQRFALMPI